MVPFMFDGWRYYDNINTFATTSLTFFDGFSTSFSFFDFFVALCVFFLETSFPIMND